VRARHSAPGAEYVLNVVDSVERDIPSLALRQINERPQ
jgi:hypothetical protein